MRVLVDKPYMRPYENPMDVLAGEQVIPDFGRTTDIEGWVWCAAPDGRSGWAPRDWIVRTDGTWTICRDYNALELTVAPGELLEVIREESGFYWAKKVTGETGWVPCSHVTIAD